ncbi:14657_t:CDS:2, partial [Dentiscutata erythropus]
GYNLLTEHYLSDINNPKTLHIKQKVNAIAYMDDTTYITSTKEELIKLLSLVEEFSSFTGMTINHTKSELLTINVTKPKEQKASIEFGKQKITDVVLDICNTIRRKRLTDKETRYIINHYKAGFTQTVINSICTTKLGYELYDTYYRYAQQHINTLSARINDQSIMGATTRIRLQVAQNQIWIPNSILEANISKEQIILYQNLTLDILMLAKQYGIEWSTSTISLKITTTVICVNLLQFTKTTG